MQHSARRLFPPDTAQLFCKKRSTLLSSFLRFPLSFNFIKIKHKSTYSLNSAIRAHISSGNFEKALNHFAKFKENGLLPDNFTIPALLKLCHGLSQPALHVEHIHAFVIKNGYLQDMFICTSFVEIYYKYGCFSASYHLFDEMPERDVVLWTALICGLSQNGLVEEALSFFSQMLRDGLKPNQMTLSSVLSACSQLMVLGLGKAVHGFSVRNGILKPDVILETALVDMYVKCGNSGYATRVFDRMECRNLVSWNAIIIGNASNGSPEIALGLFREMVMGGVKEPRSSTIVSALQVCGETVDLRHGREIHANVVRAPRDSDLDSLVVNNAIIDMYAKGGDIESAVSVFSSVRNKNLVTWTTIITGYGMHGLSKEALAAFNEMKKFGIRPDGITFVALLSACSHGRLVDEGWELYVSMQRDYEIVPEMRHFACVVDLFGRAGLVEKAYNFINTMPMEPSQFIWAALLSSCRLHKKLELGEIAAQNALALNQHNAGVYVLLSRIYADSGRWDDLSKMRLVMKDLGLMPETARSWVEVDRILYNFTVGDNLNSNSDEIYKFLEMLKIRMEKVGIFSDRSGVGHKICDEEKDDDLCGHTEKLALAFVLIKSRDKGRICIAKNLRVCKDCHETFKFTSGIINHDIILRDPNRYHKFRQGHCSCGDFW